MIMPLQDSTTTQFTIERSLEIDASPQLVYEAILAQLDGNFDTEDDAPFPMKLEARPGGRWYRDLGEDAGHLWGHVQAIKPGNLLEIWGPLFMSLAVVNNVQYRMVANEAGSTTLTFHHRAFGEVPMEDLPDMEKGWTSHLARVQRDAEAGKNWDKSEKHA